MADRPEPSTSAAAMGAIAGDLADGLGGLGHFAEELRAESVRQQLREGLVQRLRRRRRGR